MLYIYIATVVVMLALILFTSLAIITISKTTSENIKKKTMELASLYDYLLEEHSQELRNKKRLIEQVGYAPAAQGAAEAGAEQAQPTAQEAGNAGANATMKTMETIGKARYQTPIVAEAYQEIRSSFNTPLDEVLAQIPALETAAQTQSDAEQLLEHLPYETVYSMSFLPEAQQLACLQETLPAAYMPILDGFLQREEAFFSLDFYAYLREMAEEESKKAIVYVSPNIAVDKNAALQVQVRDEICEGVQVEVNHKLYDFAIEKKEMGWVCQH